jgi:hypothetical protein
MNKVDVLKLHYQDDSHTLTTEETGIITLCVTNTSGNRFVFYNTELLGADQIPGIDAVPGDTAKLDVIYFYYDYSDAERSLTNENSRDSIAVSSDDPQFSVAVDKTPAYQRYFKIFAQGTEAVIDPYSTITFSVNATCSKTPGEAVTIFKYSDDTPKDSPRTDFSIEKCRKPVIDTFIIDGAGYRENEPVTFRWTVNHIEKFTVHLNDIPVSIGQTSYHLNVSCIEYTLYVKNRAGYVSSKMVRPDFGIVFEQVTGGSKNSVNLQWDVSRLFDPAVKISRGDTGESKTFLENSGTAIFDNITADVVFRLDYKIYDKEILVICPKIIEFDISKARFLLSPREFIPPEEVAENTCSIVQSFYDGPRPGPRPPSPPPMIDVCVKWKMEGDYCTINDTKSSEHEAQCVIKTQGAVEFRAYTNYGLYVSQSKSV